MSIRAMKEYITFHNVLMKLYDDEKKNKLVLKL